MDAEIQYVIEELKLLSSSDLSLRDRIDVMIRFYLTGLGALVTASIAALEYLTSETLLGIALSLSTLGIFTLGAFVFFRILHIRFRRLEAKVTFFGLRRILVNRGFQVAGLLSSTKPRNDLRLTGRNGMMLFALCVVSSLGLGLSVGAFLWSIARLAVPVVVALGLVGMAVPLVGLILIQTEYARRVDEIIAKPSIVEPE
jgi:hypothetical protein